MINVIAWVIAIAAWLVIVLAPVALVGLAVVPSWRRWWLRPLLRLVTGRRPELVALRTGLLELEAYGSSDLASAFPPECRHMADKRCAVCEGPLGAAGGNVIAMGGGAYMNSVAPAVPYVDEYIRGSRLFGG